MDCLGHDVKMVSMLFIVIVLTRAVHGTLAIPCGILQVARAIHAVCPGSALQSKSLWRTPNCFCAVCHTAVCHQNPVSYCCRLPFLWRIAPLAVM